MAQYALNGSGTIALTSGTQRLFVATTVFPAGYSTGLSAPQNYYHVGRLRLGVQGAYYPVIPIDGADIVVDVPVGVTTLGYYMNPGGSIQVTEVFDVYQPFPAGGVHVPGLFATPNLPGDSAQHTILTYTCPSGSSALIEYAFGAIGISTVTGTCSIQVLFAGLQIYYNTINGPLNLTTQGSWLSVLGGTTQLKMNAGEAITVNGWNYISGTQIAFQVGLVIVQYPQPMW